MSYTFWRVGNHRFLISQRLWFDYYIGRYRRVDVMKELNND